MIQIESGEAFLFSSVEITHQRANAEEGKIMADNEDIRDDANPGDGSDDKGQVDNFDDAADVSVELFGEDDKPADKDAEKPDKTEKKDDPDELSKLKAETDRLNRKITDLNKALHEERRSKKQPAKEDDGAQFNKAELLKLFREFKDDPDTLFQIVAYTAEQAAKGASKEAVDKSEIAKNKKETDAFLQKNYPQMFEENSDIRRAVDEVKSNMMLAEHPYGDFLGVATQLLINAPRLMQQAYENGRKEAMNGKADEKRKADVKDNQLMPKGKGNTQVSQSLTDGQRDVAKRLGITDPKKLATFANIVGKSPRTIHVEG